MSEFVTPHFKWSEFLDSDTAVALGIVNIPGDYEKANIVQLARKLESVRLELGCPIIINSGYRCRLLNDNIPNSSSSSYHIDGRAVDIRTDHFDDYTFDRLWDLLRSRSPVELYCSNDHSYVHVAY